MHLRLLSSTPVVLLPLTQLDAAPAGTRLMLSAAAETAIRVRPSRAPWVRADRRRRILDLGAIYVLRPPVQMNGYEVAVDVGGRLIARHQSTGRQPNV